MRRSRAPGNHADRWMISWADFLTLLFALFVLLFATAQRDEGRARLAASVRHAMGDDAAREEKAQLESAAERLKRELKDEIASGRLQVATDPRGVVVTLRDEAFFASGTDALYPSVAQSLGKIAEVLRGLSNTVLLEGHTDSLPVHNGRFRSNWDLSSARSIAVLDLFVTQFGIAPERFGIAGYADNRPVDGNSSEAGRAHNRRVDIVIQNGGK